MAKSRSDLEACVWSNTPADYRVTERFNPNVGAGRWERVHGSDRAVLVMGPAGTTYKALSEFSDAELRAECAVRKGAR